MPKFDELLEKYQDMSKNDEPQTTEEVAIEEGLFDRMKARVKGGVKSAKAMKDTLWKGNDNETPSAKKEYAKGKLVDIATPKMKKIRVAVNDLINDFDKLGLFGEAGDAGKQEVVDAFTSALSEAFTAVAMGLDIELDVDELINKTFK